MDKKWARLAVSAVLLFHLVGVLTSPNPYSFLSQSISRVYRPYMNFFGLAHTWGFFAPEPISPPMYLDYELEVKNHVPVSGRFPDETNPFFFRDRHNRRMSMSRFIASSDENIRNMFVHYLCQQNPGMISGKLWRSVGTQPSLEMVQRGEKKMTDPVEFKIEALGTYFCPEDL
ncbi:MAG: hypothetical protein ACXWQO_01885 [Bdellovibrionota bacterium]